MSIDVIAFNRPLRADGPVDWAAHLGEVLAAGDAWQALEPQIHVIHSGRQPVARVTAMSDGRGILESLAPVGQVLSSLGVTPAFARVNRLHLGPGPDEVRFFPLLTVPSEVQPPRTLGQLSLAGLIRWRHGYPGSGK